MYVVEIMIEVRHEASHSVLETFRRATGEVQYDSSEASIGVVALHCMRKRRYTCASPGGENFT